MSRIATGLFLAIGWLLLLFAGNYPLFCLVIISCGIIALHEFLRMTLKGAETRLYRPVLLAGVLPLLGGAVSGSDGMHLGLFLAFLVLVVLTVVSFPVLENSMTFIGRQWLGVFYIGFCSTHLILLRSMADGIYWLLVLTAITVFSDSAAYYAGSLLGKTKLYPALSPGKTRAGAVGGIIGGTVGGVAACAVFLQDVNLVPVGFLSLFLSAIGIIGDLLESLIKRISGVKDSGQILPGHGGLLDRCDSILLTAPVLYYGLSWFHNALMQ